MLSHPTHALKPRISSFTRHFVQPHNIYEDLNIMQTDYTQSASPAQHHHKQGNGLFLVCLLSLGAFLFYAVQTHLITDAFVAVISLFFDKFSVKSTSTTADISLLIFFAVFTMGAVDILKNHFKVFIAVAIIAVIVAVAK